MPVTSEIAAEVFSERSAICEFDGLLTREAAEAMGLSQSEKYRFACEVRTVLSMPFESRRDYLNDVEKKRGKGAADALRAAVQTEWIRRKAA